MSQWIKIEEFSTTKSLHFKVLDRKILSTNRDRYTYWTLFLPRNRENGNKPKKTEEKPGDSRERQRELPRTKREDFQGMWCLSENMLLIGGECIFKHGVVELSGHIIPFLPSKAVLHVLVQIHSNGRKWLMDRGGLLYLEFIFFQEETISVAFLCFLGVKIQF